MRRASDGAVLAEGIAVREGVLEYRRADGTIRRELVTREAVLSTARTVARAPLTLDHPKGGFVRADSIADLGVGDVDGEVVVEEDAQGGFARVKVAIRRQDAVEAFDSGDARELSPGYEVVLDETPGEHPTYGRYDARQLERDCNHLAQVGRGRGDRVFLRADSADAVQVLPATEPPQRPTTTAPPRRTDTTEVRMNPKLVALLAALGVERPDRFDTDDAALEAALPLAKQARADAAKYTDEYVEGLQKDMKTKDRELEEAKADLEKVKGEADALKADLAKRDEEAKERKDAAEAERLQGLAAKVGVKHDGLDLQALRLAIAKTRVDSVDAETPEARLDGILDVIESSVAKGGTDKWAALGGEQRADGEDPMPKRRDDFFNPFLNNLDEAQGATGGAK